MRAGLMGSPRCLSRKNANRCPVGHKKAKEFIIHRVRGTATVSLTAWFALADRAQVKTGDKVLVHAGGGGVATLGFKSPSIWVEPCTTVSNEEKAAHARELGASETILYRGLSVEDYVNQHTDGKGYDIVFDTVGGDNLDASFQGTRYGGTIVNIAARSTHDLSPMHAKSLTLQVVFLVGQ